MKHIEVSKKINLGKAVAASELKKALSGYLGKSIDIEEISGEDTDFKIKGTTGYPSGLTRHARVDLNISVFCQDQDKTARVIISGYARAARSLIIFYSFAFLLLLVVGLLPGFYETGQEESGAIDALFFLIFGIFIVFDVNNKLSVTKENLETALNSLDTMFG
ncbi:MAG: hypothetical protein CO093_09875 [Alphaproteobacteria bacterium CG_4_9_14_3_um_filter_47_13]|nr:MAG: hypothetical protein CO093_09875 [Alphaproteobacteria bacterium CG_4_9_14_3_um_filter_47_13]